MRRLLTLGAAVLVVAAAAPAALGYQNYFGFNWVGPNTPTNRCSQLGTSDPGAACSGNGSWDSGQYQSNTAGSTYCLVQWWWKANLSLVHGTGATCGVGTWTKARPSDVTGTNFVECRYQSGGASYVQCRVQ
jgi:hypothetical protein